jgi:hypothetical protein
MKLTSSFIFAVSLAVSACKSDSTQQLNAQTVANGRDTTITFSTAESSKLPSNWSAETGKWASALDDSNASLKMISNNGSDFNIAVLKSHNYLNTEIEAKVKALQGSEDQGGGLVWRYVDAKNYYIVRVNPLENNIRLYRVVDGNRKQMQSAGVKVNTGEWFTLKVKAQGSSIECYLNNEKVLSGEDQTFLNPGLIGFWSKADAVSIFDDLKIKVIK